MFKVFGAFYNVRKNGIGNYCETLLKECDTLENALEFAEVQSCAWDKVVIYGDNGEVVKEMEKK